MIEKYSADANLANLADELLRLGTATLHEAAGQLGALPSSIRCMTTGLHLVGRAVTVSGPPGDNLWLHRAVADISPGEVLIAEVGGDYEWGYWGEILSWMARARGASGVVVDGCVRDVGRLSEIGVPVFARGLCIRGTSKLNDGGGSINAPIELGDVVVNPGDLVVGDEDGVVVLPGDRVEEVVRLSIARERHEADVIEAIKTGRNTLEIYNWPPVATNGNSTKTANSTS